MFETRRWPGKLQWHGGERVVVLPGELILEGEDIVIVQDEWGDIAIHPTSPEGIKARERFGPFADWDEDDDDKDD